MAGDESFQTNDGIIQVNIPKEGEREYWINDAMRADAWDKYDIHNVTLDPAEITIEGTPKAIRWLYDWMESAAKHWRLQGEVWEARCHKDMAEILWNALPEDPPERQKNREVELV